MPATAVRIFTGAVLPQLHDTVVMQEDVVVDTTDGRTTIAIPAGLRPGANVRKAGEDVAAGSTVLEAGAVLRAQDLAALAALGVAEVDCFARLRVAIVSTGDEVVRPGAVLAEGQVYDANAPMLASLVTSAGAVATDLGIDLICSAGEAADVAGALVEAGAAQVSEPAAEILRVESGRPRFGREMSAATIPQEAGIDGRAVSFTKGCYIGQETVARLHYKGKPNRHLRGLRLDASVTQDDAIALEGRDVGRIGTAVLSPAHGPIALAVIRREAAPGALVEVGESGVRGQVVDLPF
jgi:folate-binding protein YgfZ